MPLRSYRDDQLILAARLYFLDGLSQAQVGKLVHVSQSKVSRMLALAQARGIVRVTVPEYEPRELALENALKRTVGIDAVVVRSVSGLRVREVRETLGYFAAPVVSGWLDAASVVAVAGGRTLLGLVEHMKPGGNLRPVTFAQAMGHIDSSTGAYDAVELSRVLAKKWDGRYLTLNTPAILPEAETCRRLLGLDQIRQVLEQLAKADLALVGIGTLENSVFVEHKTLTARDVEALRAAGAVGEILGRFFDASGKECSTPLQRRVVSLGLNELRGISKRVGVLAGSDRTSAVLAAVRSGLLNSLVIDDQCATALLERIKAKVPVAEPYGAPGGESLRRAGLKGGL
jgi:DNA-binding transcriptional regulator LsrR (DeoR family)